ncbi:MAG: hypothetical protein IGS39_02550 [Calothrix sp. C42_A2020_038]|nr:hypothetical protein [Calothrix sp. C42_A2020_038]
MKDHISLVAAAAGGFMLSVALTGILQGRPVANITSEASFNVSPVTYVNIKKSEVHEMKKLG